VHLVGLSTLMHCMSHATAKYQSILRVPAVMYIAFIKECNPPAYLKHVQIRYSYSSNVRLFLNDTNNYIYMMSDTVKLGKMAYAQLKVFLFGTVFKFIILSFIHLQLLETSESV
jgi:hypothetical protein